MYTVCNIVILTSRNKVNPWLFFLVVRGGVGDGTLL